MDYCYVVTATMGCYSDRTWWMVAVHDSEADAKAHADNAQRYIKEAYKKYPYEEYDYEIDQKREAFLKENPWDTTGNAVELYTDTPTYSVEKIRKGHPILEGED